MATTTKTLAPPRSALRSTVAMKVLMAVTGLILILFLLAHMLGNLKLLIPTPDGEVSEFSEYAHLLRRLFYPVFPPMVFLWLFRIVLLASLVLHMWSAVKLRVRADRNVGMKRYVVTRAMSKDYAGRTMIWGGIIITLFLILHLVQFTIDPGAFDPSYTSTGDGPRQMVLHAFTNVWYVIVYAIAMLAVVMHVWHGFWSAFTTLGANVSQRAQKVLRVCAWIFAIALYVGFMISPLAVLTKVVS